MPAISADLFKKSYTTAPKVLNAAVIDFCRHINPHAEPRYVPVTPDPSARPSECFNNVVSKVSGEGGNLVYGWLIWQWPRVFIEAEHHAVWERNGVSTDITPPIHGESEILFLPDLASTYDFAGQRRRINIKRSLGQFPSAPDWIRVTDILQKTIERHSKGSLSTIDLSKLATLSRNVQDSLGAEFIDLARCTGPNDRCFF